MRTKTALLSLLAAVLIAAGAWANETVSPVVVVPPDYNDLKNTVQNLQSRMGTAESNISNLQTSVSGLNTSVSNLSSRMGTAESNISNLTSRMGTAEANINTIFSQLGMLNTQVSQALSKADSAYSQALSAVSTASNALSTAQSARSIAQQTKDIQDVYVPQLRVSGSAVGWLYQSRVFDDCDRNWDPYCPYYIHEYINTNFSYTLPVMLTVNGVNWYLVSPKPVYRSISACCFTTSNSFPVYSWSDVEQGQRVIYSTYDSSFKRYLWYAKSPRTGKQVPLQCMCGQNSCDQLMYRIAQGYPWYNTSCTSSLVPLWQYKTLSGQTHYFLP
ncbi:MAG: alanine-zipper protein [Thermofilum sp.]